MDFSKMRPERLVDLLDIGNSGDLFAWLLVSRFQLSLERLSPHLFSGKLFSKRLAARSADRERDHNSSRFGGQARVDRNCTDLLQYTESIHLNPRVDYLSCIEMIHSHPIVVDVFVCCLILVKITLCSWKRCAA